MMESKQRIAVSPELVVFVGAGAVAAEGWPDAPVVLAFDLAGVPTLTCGDAGDDAAVVLIVAAEACRRLFGAVPDAGEWHLPADLRGLAGAILNCDAAPALCETLRAARGIELLCTATERVLGDALVAVGGGTLSELDSRRIAAARRLIDERWHEKLTLDAIARACGLNRAKLVRGFRTMYDTTVADEITRQRLGGAQRLLRSTDLPVKAIGYRCGYLNNASFTRAFARRFGLAPTQFRATALAA